jgi:hypothetical protein
LDAVGDTFSMSLLTLEVADKTGERRERGGETGERERGDRYLDFGGDFNFFFFFFCLKFKFPE